MLLQEKFKNAKYLFGEMSLPSLNLKKWAPGMLLPEMGSEDTPVLKISREKLLSYFFFLRNLTIGVAEESQSYV